MLRSLLIQLVVFTLIFQALMWFKESDMLSRHTDLNQFNFELPTTVGTNVSLAVNKKTVIYFFAPWCSICNMSIENLQAIYQANENIDVIAIGLDYRDNSEIEAFVARHQLTFPIAFGNEEVKRAYQINAYPSYYVVDSNNQVIAKSMGYSSEFGLYLRTL